jgi:Tol biopolymer transport system component
MFRTAGAVMLIAPLCLIHAQAPGALGREGPARGAIQGQLAWFDRQGNKVGTIGEPGVYRTLTVSPDGKHVAVERSDPQTQNRDIWLLNVTGGGATRFTSDPGWDAFPTWSPDGSRIIFTSNRSGVFDLYQKAVNNAANEELLYHSTDGKGPNSWSPNGKYLIFYSLGQPTHLKLLAVTGPADRAAIPIVEPQFTSITGRFSPDGRWIVYSSNEWGANEVSVRSFDPSNGAMGKAIRISNGGGRVPLWRNDGKEIVYLTTDGTVTALEVSAGTEFKTGIAKTLFKAPSGVLFWDMLPDGSRFLMPAGP